MIDLSVPGDKSISHRFLILAALARGESTLSGVPASLDVRSTMTCLRNLGAVIEEDAPGTIRVRGPATWRVPASALDCGNSGTTARLLTGLLAGLGVAAEVTGDESLQRRPMDRVVYPLQAMGATISYVDRPDRVPLRVATRASGALRTLRYRPRISSAQVRGALLLAALSGRTDLEILDHLRPRDHTERILQAMGAPVATAVAGSGDRITLRAAGWTGDLTPLEATVPGDLSGASFLVAAALLTGIEVRIRSVGLNPTRDGFLRVLKQMGAVIEVSHTGFQAGEPVGDLAVRPSTLEACVVQEGLVPQLVDEVPVLAVLASRARGVSMIRGAGELRLKESDRLALLAENLRAVGAHCEEYPDGLRVHGSRSPLSGVVRSGGDHRIAMAFGALGASPDCAITVDDPGCVDVSFPGFWDALSQVTQAEEGE